MFGVSFNLGETLMCCARSVSHRATGIPILAASVQLTAVVL